ncbi:MAG TPA: DEAD/DEAH box helicase family protein [Microbacteriaceae bacterium]|nr:DEAD/DEAH box helicase family protein [Microbacteriaceae bacterium]
MGNLRDLSLKTSYHKGRDDIAEEFLLPCLARATSYDRAVGYFRSSVFVISWPALRDFVRRGGVMRVLCSQVLGADDITSLEKGYGARAEAALRDRFVAEVRSLLDDDVLREPAQVLAALVATGVLELQIAILPEANRQSSGRIFHDKLGIISDDERNRIIFKGSMNETWSGLAADGNLESIDVAASWLGARDLQRVEVEVAYFTDLWANEYPTVLVRPFPDVARDELVRAADPDWEGTVERLLSSQDQSSGVPDARGRSLRPHQAAGLASWEANGRRGILAFATGSGKTFTAITAIREALRRNEVPLVVVPDRVLFGQWYREIAETTADVEPRILRAGAGHSRWREHLRIWTARGTRRRLVLATVQTASSDDFTSRLAGGEHLFLVADEVHRLGSSQNRRLLNDGLFGPRLGLSATPERAGDGDGTAAILDFFGGILEPRYTLADAVRDGVLTRYFYRPHTLTLSDDEHAEWNTLSAEAARLRAMAASGSIQGVEQRLQMVLIRRARIVKNAAAKVPLAVRVMEAEYRPGQRWIIYCDNALQLQQISGALEERSIRNLPFHSAMEGDRDETLRWLSERGGVVVAIKCLDEGVDLPTVSHALILASSKNPREFIQRRGRVLRVAPGKALAYIHDAIVLPPVDNDVSVGPDPITAGELARAIEFAESADNPSAASDLREIAVDAGIDWRTFQTTGYEDGE